MENAIVNNKDQLPWQHVWCQANTKDVKPVVLGAAELSPDISDALTAMVERHGERSFKTEPADIAEIQKRLRGRNLPELIAKGNREAQMFAMLIRHGSQVVIG